MVEYRCEKCEKIFKKKYDYMNHMNKIRPCDRPSNICVYCGVKYATKANAMRHIKTNCGVYMEREMGNKQIFDELSKLKEKNEKLTNVMNELRLDLVKQKRSNGRITTGVPLSKGLDNIEIKSEGNINNRVPLSKGIDNIEIKSDGNINNRVPLSKGIDNIEIKSDGNLNIGVPLSKGIDNIEIKSDGNINNGVPLSKGIDNIEIKSDESAKIDNGELLLKSDENANINNGMLILKGDEIVRNKVYEMEDELDMKMKRYNRNSAMNPMMGITRDRQSGLYILNYKTVRKKSSKLEKLVKIIIDDYNISEEDEPVSWIDYKNERLIIYGLLERPKFDIQHVLKISKTVGERNYYAKYYKYKDKISSVTLKKNAYGGYIIRELIDEETMYNMILSSNNEYAKEFKKDVSKILVKLREKGMLVVKDDQLIVNDKKEINKSVQDIDECIEIENGDNILVDIGPNIIRLKDKEKYRIDYDIHEIELRGERYGEIYYNIIDIAKIFGIQNAKEQINGYENKVEYMRYNIVIDRKTKRQIYLTYKGLVRALVDNKVDRIVEFLDWTRRKLYTRQQDEDKIDKILGVEGSIMKKVFNTLAMQMSCIYLFSLGYVKDLRKSMSIGNEYDDDSIVCKYGYSEDLARRMIEHIQKYEKIEGCTIRLLLYTYVDNSNMSSAENDLKDFVEISNMGYEYDKERELLIVKKEIIKTMKKQFDQISKVYKSNTAGTATIDMSKKDKIINDINAENIKLKHDLENTKLRHELENMKLRHELENMKLSIMYK